MLHIEREIIIERPVEAVFDFLADGRTEPRYNPHMLRAEQIPAGPIGRGKRFRTVVKGRGRPQEMSYEITDYDRPRRLASRLIAPLPVMDVCSTETFDRVPVGTRLRWVWDVEPRGVFTLLSPLLSRLLNRRLAGVLTNIKGVLEAPEAPTSPTPRRTGTARAWLALVGIACGFYGLVLRPRMLNRGATADERTRPLPGDELVPHPTATATRAVTIHATASAIWPWLLQMGQDRAGFYTHNWVERLLHSGIPDVHELHPEWQQLRVGDLMRTNREITPGHPLGWLVARVDAERARVLRSKSMPRGTYALALEPADGRSTRLLARDRAVWPWWQYPFWLLLYEPLHVYMQGGVLHGLKQRVERVTRPASDA